MFKKLLLLSILVSSIASAKDLSVKDLRERLEMSADIYQVDGKKIVSGPERTTLKRTNSETGEIEGSWSSGFNFGDIILRYNYKVQEDGTIKATIEEFAKSDKDGNFSESLDKKELVLENFEPIVWKVKNIKDKTFIVRFILTVREISSPVAIEKIPVSGTNIMVTDSAGYLWSRNTNLDGNYISVRTHRGSIAMSYVPFKGAKEMGSAEGNEINLTVDKNFKIQVKSETAFLPAGMVAKVYAIYLPEVKSKGVNSINSSSSSDEGRFLERLRR